jgi:hypothetical protein
VPELRGIRLVEASDLDRADRRRAGRQAAAADSRNAAERESFRMDEIWVRKRADASPIDWPVNGG